MHESYLRVNLYDRFCERVKGCLVKGPTYNTSREPCCQMHACSNDGVSQLAMAGMRRASPVTMQI